MVGSLYVLNHIDSFVQKSPVKKSRFDVVKKVKKTVAKKKAPPKKKKKKTTKTMKPLLDLNFAVGGLDLGIDALALGMGQSRLLSGSGNEVFTEDLVDQVPVVTHRDPLVYPEEAVEDKINGSVTLRILVKSTGRVGQVNVVNSEPQGLFDQSALAAVRSWVFQPAELKGKPVNVWMKQRIQFRLN